MKRWIHSLISVIMAVVLCIFSCLTGYTAVVRAVDIESLITDARTIIFRNEGGYYAFNANDGGAISVGGLQWHGTRALNLFKMIVNANTVSSYDILGSALYNEICNSADWSTRIPNAAESNALKALLNTSESIEAQNNLAYSDVKSYLNTGKNYGLTDAAALVYFADLQNQRPLSAKNIVNAAISLAGSASSITLSQIHSCALNDEMIGAKFAQRRNNTYNYCSKLVVPDPNLPCKINDISGYDGPKEGYVHTPGANCGLYGTITSNHPLKHVWGGVYNQDGTKAPGSSTTCDDYPNTTSYSLRGTFNNAIYFNDIPVGSYFFSISAEDNDGYSREVFHCNFTVGNPSITVSFIANGGSVSPTSKTYQIGGKYSDLPTPSRKGYIFDGWYSLASGGTKVSNGSDLISSSGHTLYAHWKDDMRKIYFNANGGICSTEYITRRYGDKYGDMPVPSNSGYKFLGWYTAAQGGDLRNSSSEVVEADNYTLYAHWIADDYIVVFNKNGGSGFMSNQTVARDQSVALTANAFTAPTGYSFSNWNTKADGSGTSYSDKASVKNLAAGGGSITLYAIWNPNTYTIKYDANTGSGSMDNSTMTYDKAANLRKNAYTRTGYSFESWSDGNGNYYADQASVKNLATSGTVTLWVKWKPNTYKVTLDDGSGKTTSINVTYDGKYSGLTDPVRDGYNFAGWYTEKDGKGTLISKDTTVKVTAAQTLYANWSKEKIRITFNANGGTSEMSQKLVSYDTKYGVLPNAEKAGYDFGGWYLDEGFTQQITADSIVKITKNQEVYAKWVQIKLIVTFDPNGGTVDMETKKVVSGKVYGVLPEAEKDGFVFVGWFTEGGTEITSDSTVEFTDDTTVYAKWRLKGDVDADGDVDINDVIMLQQWLLAVPDAILNDWRAGDLCQDERIDMYDLWLLKRLLIERNGDI